MAAARTIQYAAPRTSRPSSPGPLSPEWVSRGLIAAYLPSGVSSGTGTRGYTTVTQDGVGIGRASDSGGPGVAAGQTFFTVTRLRTTTADAVALGRIKYGGGSNFGTGLRFNGRFLEFNVADGSGNWTWANLNDAVVPGRRSYAATLPAGAPIASAVFWVDGVRWLPSATSGGTPVVTQPDRVIDLGLNTAPGSSAITDAMDGHHEVALHFSGGLTDELIARLHHNPYQVFADEQRAITFAAASGTDFTGGSSSLVDVYVSGAGTASISTGSSSPVTVSQAGLGRPGVSQGSSSPVTVNQVGAGSLAVGAGSSSTVTITAVGSGSGSVNPAFAGGSSSSVVVDAVGAGRIAVSVGSSSSVLISQFGAGYASPFSGSSSIVTVTAVGDGTKFEEAGKAGGAHSVTTITAVGAGVAAIYGGSSSSVLVTARGSGLSSLVQAAVKRIKTAYNRITEASVIVFPVRTRKGWWFPKR